MTLYSLEVARGEVGKKLSAVTASITGTGSITTGLGTIEAAVVCPHDADALGAAATQELGTITAISGGTVTVSIPAIGTTPSVAQSADAKTIGCIAVGN